MATTPEDSSQRSTNLARVRDNQRRSRARRKEYLNDLETKYRHCEQVGVEASAAIQEAARRVVEENKRLRELLRRHGISSEEDRNEGAVLDGVLGRRWGCGGNGGGGGGGGGGGCSSASPPTTHSPATSTFTDQRSSPRIPNVVAPAVPERLLPQQGQQQGQPQDPIMSSSSTTGSTTSSGMHTPSSTEWQQPQAPTITTTTTTMGDYPRSIPTSIPPPDQEHNFYNELYPYYDLQNFTPHQQQQQQQQYDSSSCHDVACVIRAINPDMVPELESEMGCEDGRDCDVPNARAFDLLDRFSEKLNAL